LLKKTLIFTLLFLVAIQFLPVDKTNPPVNDKITLSAPKDVMGILKKACYDCHSFETKWPYYSDIAPVSFFVAAHVKDARKALNFSKYKEIDKDIKKKRLERAVMTVNNGRMALPSYVSAHDEAKLSKDEKILLTEWFKKEIAKL